ncbi:MAG: MGMT family protein [Ilumatobacter sp.]|nr:MGMT family protein [bacterium]MDG1265929.1 MGMT family protein [Ilumatobacter sp.]MDG2039674.1 MGMT family protein [Ilumatobacter sp.]
MGDDRALRKRRIINVLLALEEGEVTTYGDVAEVAGYPKQSRLVGRILRDSATDIPWWRVVGSQGRIRTANPALQAELLVEENVLVAGGRILEAPIGRFRRCDL